MAHRLHVPPWYTDAAPYNDIPLPARTRAIVPQGIYSPWLTIAPEVTINDHSAPVLFEETPEYGLIPLDDCLYGWHERWSATQNAHVAVDLTGVPTSVGGVSVDAITLLMPGVQFAIDTVQYPYAWTVTVAVDGDEIASVDWIESGTGPTTLASVPPYLGGAGWPYREPVPVPPVYFGAPPSPPSEWSFWWGAALGDDFPSEVTWDVDVTFFDVHHHFRPNTDLSGTCAVGAAEYASRQTDETAEGIGFADIGGGFPIIPGAGVNGYTLEPSDERAVRVMVV